MQRGNSKLNPVLGPMHLRHEKLDSLPSFAEQVFAFRLLVEEKYLSRSKGCKIKFKYYV